MLGFSFAAGGPWILDSNTVVMIALLSFLGLVYWKGWPLVRNLLDARIDEVKSELYEAQRLREEAQALLLEYESKHKSALDEAEAIIAAAKENAAALRAKAEADLKDSLSRREAAAKVRIAQAEAAALADAQAAAVDQAIAAAERLFREQLDADRDAALVDEAMALISGRLH